MQQRGKTACHDGKMDKGKVVYDCYYVTYQGWLKTFCCLTTRWHLSHTAIDMQKLSWLVVESYLNIGSEWLSFSKTNGFQGPRINYISIFQQRGTDRELKRNGWKTATAVSSICLLRWLPQCLMGCPCFLKHWLQHMCVLLHWHSRSRHKMYFVLLTKFRCRDASSFFFAFLNYYLFHHVLIL